MWERLANVSKTDKLPRLMADDHLTLEARSRNMRAVGSKNTTPEKAVRSTLHRMGYRFRLHRRDLPGTPDVCFPKARKVIFVNGCFWHRHERCKYAYTPKARQEFWLAKFTRNVERDKAAVDALRASGWDVLVVWECETRDLASLKDKLSTFLGRRVGESAAR